MLLAQTSKERKETREAILSRWTPLLSEELRVNNEEESIELMRWFVEKGFEQIQATRAEADFPATKHPTRNGSRISQDLARLYIKPENGKGPRRIHLKGHAALYLREKNKRRLVDCPVCNDPSAAFDKSSFLQLWLGNVEIEKVEGSSKAEAEKLLLSAIASDGHYRSLIPLAGKDSKQPYALDDLILAEKLQRHSDVR